LAKKRDIRRLEAVAAEFKMTGDERRAFGDYVEASKAAGDRGSESNGDFSFEELRTKALEFRGEGDGR